MKKLCMTICMICMLAFWGSIPSYATSIPTDVLKNLEKERYSASDLRYLTSIIYCEARGECDAGKKAVGIVVMNRVGSELFPDDIISVIYQRGQFSPVTNGSLDKALALYDRQKEENEFDSTMLSCFEAAESVLEGSRQVEMNDGPYDMGDYLFFSRYISNSRYQIGNHQFR